MALIKCPECGKEISDAAESCPNCGYPIKGQQQIGDSDGLGKGQETKKLKTVLFIVVGIILVVIVCGGSLLFKKGGLIDKLTDKEAPKFENVPTELTFNVDDDVKFNDIVKEKNIKVTDNVDTDIEIKIDSSQVKLDVPGKYLITLSARDKAKNIGKVEVPVYVNDYETHKEYLAAITLEKSKLDKSSSGSYQYEGITVPDSEVNNIEAGTMYRSISRQLEGFYLFGNMIYKNWNTEIASTVFGIDKPESYDDMKPYVDSVFSYITPDATLPQILSWIQECTTVSGEFDYEKANFSFEITDLTATAKEMHITEKMLGYVLAVIDEYGPEENFKGKPVREIYGLLQKQTDQQQRYYFRMNTKGERKKMYVLKNGKNFYIRIENGSVIKTPKFVEATKFRNTEIAQTVIDLKPGQLHSYRVCDVYNKIVYPKGRTRVIYTPRERKMIYHKAEGRCQLCGCKITYDEMSLDHIVPLAMGGEDSLENLQATCEPCNSHKKALLPEAYFDKVNRTFVFQMNKKYSHNLLWKLSKLFIGRLEKQA